MVLVNGVEGIGPGLGVDAESLLSLLVSSASAKYFRTADNILSAHFSGTGWSSSVPNFNPRAAGPQ